MILVGLFNLNEYVHYGTVTMHKEQMAFSGGAALTILITEFVGGSIFVFYSIYQIVVKIKKEKNVQLQ